MHTQLMWRGKPIDMDEFCRENGSRKVRYKATRTVPGLDGTLRTERIEGEIPEPFWDNLRMTDGWIYRRL